MYDYRLAYWLNDSQAPFFVFIRNYFGSNSYSSRKCCGAGHDTPEAAVDCALPVLRQQMLAEVTTWPEDSYGRSKLSD